MLDQFMDAGTPEQVALRLLDFIRHHTAETFATQNHVLDAYADCLKAVRGERSKG